MKKQVCILLIFFSFYKLSAQIKECPTRSQKDYDCGNVEESILKTLDQREYKIASHFNIRLIHSLKSKGDADKANKVVALCNQVLNDPDFWNAVENYKKYKYSVFENEKGEQQISGIQIVNCLINGVPNDNTRPLKVEIPLRLNLYGLAFKIPFESAVAKEIGDGTIYNKKWFFRNDLIHEIGSNWIHEFSHIKGLTHCYFCNEERDYSVPYVLNRIFIEVAKKYVLQE